MCVGVQFHLFGKKRRCVGKLIEKNTCLTIPYTMEYANKNQINQFFLF